MIIDHEIHKCPMQKWKPGQKGNKTLREEAEARLKRKRVQSNIEETKNRKYPLSYAQLYTQQRLNCTSYLTSSVQCIQEIQEKQFVY